MVCLNDQPYLQLVCVRAKTKNKQTKKQLPGICGLMYFLFTGQNFVASQRFSFVVEILLKIGLP